MRRWRRCRDGRALGRDNAFDRVRQGVVARRRRDPARLSRHQRRIKKRDAERGLGIAARHFASVSASEISA